MENMSEVEIKALIYDHMVAIEKSQATIRALNQELAKRASKPSVVEIPTNA